MNDFFRINEHTPGPVFFWLLIFQLFSSIALGQQKLETNKYMNTSVVTASPSAATFKVFGDTPVSQFTGTPDITIPLHEAAFKELSVDLSLRYHHAIGSKPDAFPGPVGNGWMMNTGVITRLSRGVTAANFSNPVPVNSNPTADPNWSTTSKMESYIQTQTIFVNDEGRYDEYGYSFAGSSGKFYIDHMGAFRIKTAQGEDILVEKDPALASKDFALPTETQTPSGCTNSPYMNVITARDFIYKFTLTDSRGVKYVFGGKDEAIEFTRTGMHFGVFDVTEQNTIPTSWYLTSVESPNGYAIDLNYTRGKFYVTNERIVSDKIIAPNSWAGNEPGNLNAPSGKRTNSTMYHPCYLDEIVTPISKVKFNWSIASEQLGYDFTLVNCNELNDNGAIYFYAYPQVKDASMAGRFPNKLDNLVVSTVPGIRKKKVVFNYSNSTSTRLKLLSVILDGDSDTPSNVPVYTFSYNTAVPLPAYLSFKTDKWGFYNNKGHLYMASNDPEYYYDLFSNEVTRQAYLDSRQPDPAYTQAEILNRVTYPTGGYTEYEYENNDYGRIARFWPATILENEGGTSQFTGGLRIKRIINYDYTSHVATEKKYFYKKDYVASGATSSGVLSFEPRYYAYFSGSVTAPARWAGTPGASNFTGAMTYKHYSTDPLNQSYRSSNHVTYSEVTEMDLDGSYKVYKFKNYDNGYHDRDAENFISDNANVGAFWKDDEMNSLETERGQILSEESYTSANTLRQSNTYAYTADASRFDNHVRRLKLIPNPIFSVNYPSLRYTASLIYTYYPYIESKTTTNYETGGSIQNTQTYTYNEQYRTVSSVSSLNSKGQAVVVSKTYPHDYPADAVSVAMTDKHMIAPVVETTASVDGAQASLVHTTYYSPSADIYVPQEIKVQNGAHPIEVRQKFNQYDTKGNLLEQQKPDDVKEAYVWGYNGQYLMAKVLGTGYAQLNADDYQGFIDDVTTPSADVVTALNEMRTSLMTAYPAVHMTTYTYEPLVGVSTVTDPNNKVTAYQYDALGRLKSVHNATTGGAVRASYCYNYAGQPTDCANLAPTGNIAAQGLVLLAEQANPALPVTLVEFEAKKSENSGASAEAMLTWVTTNESNSDHFEINRSKDGREWETLDSVAAKGESSELQKYFFVDKAPLSGENLYRLRMVDKDDTYAYSRIQSVVFDKDGNVAFYPNPVTVGQKLNLLTDQLEKINDIRIFDASGKLVYQSVVAKQINISRLPAGLYMVHITYTDGSMSTHRIVKQ